MIFVYTNMSTDITTSTTGVERPGFLHVMVDDGSETFLLTRLEGSCAISECFCFQLSLLSRQGDISPEKMLEKTLTITLTTTFESTVFNGMITRFVQKHVEYDGYRLYEATVEPRLSLLRYRRDSQIYQNQTVPEIIQAVFKACGYRQYTVDELSARYEKRAYCVRYNETALDFVARLLEEEGIYYTFLHQNGQHTLVLHDSGFHSSVADRPLKYQPGADTPHFYQWQRHKGVVTNQFSQQAFRYQTPTVPAATHKENVHQNPSSLAKNNYEYVQYNGSLYNESQDRLDNAARFFIQRKALEAEHLIAKGNYLSLQPNQKFKVTTHPRASELGDYVLRRIRLQAYDMTGREHQAAKSQADAQSFEADYEFFPARLVYRPPLITPKPKISNIQTAKVVGPQGQEIYTDSDGRIKVQFMWDRYSQPDEKSSCWLRCLSPWAGAQRGIQFIPRVGQEVLVDYEGGNPDKPFVVGTVSNADNLPPFTPEDTPYRSGLKTHLFGESSSDKGHVLMFDDSRKHAQIYLKSQHNMNVHVKGEATSHIQGNSDITVKSGNYMQCVNGVLTVKAKDKITLACGDSEIAITEGGITIQGDTIDIDQLPVDVSGLGGEVSLKEVVEKLTPSPQASSSETAAQSTLEDNSQQIAQKPDPERVTVSVMPRWRKWIVKESPDCQWLLRLPYEARDLLTTAFIETFIEEESTFDETNFLQSFTANLKIFTHYCACGVSQWAQSLDALYELASEEIQSACQKRIDYYKTQALLSAQPAPEPHSVLEEELYAAWQAIEHPKELAVPKSSCGDTSLSKEQQLKLAFFEKHLETWLNLLLQIGHSPALRNGWLYIFAQSDKDPLYQHTALVNEYQIEGELFKLVDLSRYGGCDHRPGQGASLTVDIPYLYEKSQAQHLSANTPSDYNIYIFFSGMQLSWPRLAAYGGMSEQDPRLSILAKKEAQAFGRLQKIQKLAHKDRSRLLKRAGQALDPTTLLPLFNQQVLNIRAGVNELSFHYDLPSLQKSSVLYALTDHSALAPLLLLDDPLGVCYEAHMSWAFIKAKINEVINQTLGDISGQSALLANQCFFNLRGAGITEASNPDGIFGYSFGESDRFKQQAGLYESLVKAQKDLDRSKILATLKSGLRTALKAWLKAYQQVATDVLCVDTPSAILEKAKVLWQGTVVWQPQKAQFAPYQDQGGNDSEFSVVRSAHFHNDVNLAIEDGFCQEGSAYYQAFTAFMGLWQFTLERANQLDSTLDKSPLPMDSVQVLHAGRTAGSDPNWQKTLPEVLSLAEPGEMLVQALTSLYHRLTLKGYVTTHFYEVGFKLFYQIRVIDTANQTVNTQPEQCLYTLAMPPGYLYLAALLDKSHPLAEIVWPTDATSQSAQEIFYQGTGLYNAFAFKKIKDSTGENYRKAVQAQTEQLQAALGETAISMLEGSLEKLGEFLHGVADAAEGLIEQQSQMATSLKKRLAAFICDLYGLDRDAIKVAMASEVSNTYKPLAHQIIEEGERLNLRKLKLNKAMLAHDDEAKDHVYFLEPEPKSKGQTGTHYRYVQDYEEVIEHYRAQKGKVADKVLTMLQKYSRQGVSLFHVEQNVLGKTVPIHFVLALISYRELHSAYREMQESPDFYTYAQFFISLAQSLQSTHTTLKVLAKISGFQYLKVLDEGSGLKNVLGKSSQLLGSEMLGATLGLSSNLLSAFQAYRSLISDAAANDPALAVSDWLSLGAAGTAAGSTVKKIVAKEASQNAAEEMIAKGAEGLAKNISKQTEHFFGRALWRYSTCEILELLIPGLDILDMLTIAFQLGSLICQFFKDNQYQSWAKQSQFGLYLTKTQVERLIKLGKVVKKPDMANMVIETPAGPVLTPASQLGEVYYRQDGQPLDNYSEDHHFFASLEEEYQHLLTLFLSPSVEVLALNSAGKRLSSQTSAPIKQYVAIGRSSVLPGTSQAKLVMQTLMVNQQKVSNLKTGWFSGATQERFVARALSTAQAVFGGRPLYAPLTLHQVGISQVLNLKQFATALLAGCFEYLKENYPKASKETLWQKLVESGLMLGGEDSSYQLAIPVELLSLIQCKVTLPANLGEITIPYQAPRPGNRPWKTGGAEKVIDIKIQEVQRLATTTSLYAGDPTAMVATMDAAIAEEKANIQEIDKTLYSPHWVESDLFTVCIPAYMVREIKSLLLSEQLPADLPTVVTIAIAQKALQS